ncbi:Helix-turn-helix domain protein [Rubripirellula tenax]|uniref:Helix-turn-helix domain protein n=1 Tax=Rubripirellula tenax TaxID=2528015 RepID=A0A5C6F589_9BACT|nr:helix-turn-helix domain-containing protein [Rubripirellula tenax]TWU56375.1 Helix-turn-helix domain protein [Rubripirellula tenax]
MQFFLFHWTDKIVEFFLNPTSQDESKPKLPRMNDDERIAYEQAVALEILGKEANIAAARLLIPELLERIRFSVELVAQLREARQRAGVSLDEMQERTGIQKSALSRLENSHNPNPTLSTLRRYAEAIGMRLDVSLSEAG